MLFAAGPVERPDEIPSAAAPSSASEALLPAHERLTRKLASDLAKGRETVAQTLAGVNAWSQGVNAWSQEALSKLPPLPALPALGRQEPDVARPGSIPWMKPPLP